MQQRRAHDHTIASATADSPGPAADEWHLLGYATWVSTSALRVPEPLTLRETNEDTGTRIWASSWLHRSWALSRPDLFPPGCHVLELGAGVGLLGLSVALAYPGVRVTLSDFQGHCTGKDNGSVLHNLRHNVTRNAPLLGVGHGADGADSRVRVVELDWRHPDRPRLWFPQQDTLVPSSLDDGADGGGRSLPPLCALEPADVVLGTECLYTAEGTRHLFGTLAGALRRPSGACFLVNNSRRTGSHSELEGEGAKYGFAIEQLGSLSDDESTANGGAMSTFAPPWDDSEDFVLLRVTWKCG